MTQFELDLSADHHPAWLGNAVRPGGCRASTSAIGKTFDHGSASKKAIRRCVTPELAKSVRGIAAFGGIDAAFIDALPKLEIIASFGVGYDSVDAGHAGKRGVMVTNTPDVLTEEVADTAIGLLINTVRELSRAEAYLRAGPLGERGTLPADRRDLARPARRHFRHGPHRAGHRAAAGGVRAVGRLSQPPAGRGPGL